MIAAGGLSQVKVQQLEIKDRGVRVGECGEELQGCKNNQFYVRKEYLWWVKAVSQDIIVTHS